METLKTIIPTLCEEFEKNETLFESFLSGTRLSASQLKPFRTATAVDCFGERQQLSNFFLNNFIFQVRNVFLAEHDFTWSEMILNKGAISPLQTLVEQEIGSLKASDAFIERVLGGFTRTKKKKIVPVLPARNTSKRCSFCGKPGNLSGKQCTFPHFGLSLDADLNAARNIVNYKKPNHASSGASH